MLWAIERSLYRSALVLAEAGVAVDNLLVAAALNRVDRLGELLSPGVDVDTRYWGLTALHGAAAMGHADVVTWLLARGADPTLRDTRWNGTAAGWARHARHPEIADLIEKR
jgi:hypothetical protein